MTWFAAAGVPVLGWLASRGQEMNKKQENPMGHEQFTITEKQAKQRQDGSWYMETVKVEKSALA